MTVAVQCLAIFILRGASPWPGDLNGTPLGFIVCFIGVFFTTVYQNAIQAVSLPGSKRCRPRRPVRARELRS